MCFCTTSFQTPRLKVRDEGYWNHILFCIQRSRHGRVPSQHHLFILRNAKDLWRVVSSYSESDIKNYYADATVAASGVQKYDWESPLLTETRHLDFSQDQHKILETELKMLCELPWPILSHVGIDLDVL